MPNFLMVPIKVPSWSHQLLVKKNAHYGLQKAERVLAHVHLFPCVSCCWCMCVVIISERSADDEWWKIRSAGAKGESFCAVTSTSTTLLSYANESVFNYRLQLNRISSRSQSRGLLAWLYYKTLLFKWSCFVYCWPFCDANFFVSRHYVLPNEHK